MAALGGPTSWYLGVRWDGVTFTDESAYLKADDGHAIKVTRGGDSDGELQVGVLSAVLDNALASGLPGSLGRFTPDNALSPLSPNVVDGVWTRFGVTRSPALESIRHRGRAALATPQLPDGEFASSQVALQSVDMLGTIDGRELDCDFVEQWRNRSETETVDCYPLDEQVSTPTELRNIGSGTGTARVVLANSRAGSAKTVGADGIALDGAVEVKPNTSGIGPVIIGDTSTPVGSVLSIVITFRSTDRTAAVSPVDKYVAVGLSAAGAVLWSVRLKDDATQCDLNLYDAAGAFVGTLVFGFSAIGESDGNGEWYSLHLQRSGVSNLAFLQRAADGVLAYSSTGVDIRDTDSIVLGGLSSAKKGPGRQTNCVAATFGAFVITTSTNSHASYLVNDALTPVQSRFVDLNLYCDFASAQIGTRNRTVTRKGSSGRSGFAVAAELARTTQSLVVASRASDGTLLFYDADQLRQPTVALTIDLNLDAGDGDLPWRKGGTYSRCKASWPGGSVEWIDATRPRNDTTRETCAADAGHALEVASAVVNSQRLMQLESVEVDLASADTDLWVAMMALEVGARIRCVIGTASSLAAQHYGRTYIDCYVTGWEEVYARDVARWTLTLITADDPAVGVWSTGDRAKWQADPGSMTVTGGTCVGTTGTGTLIVTTAGSSPRLSTTATGLVLNWNGEWVACSAAAGASSPQTVTVTGRGQGPTIARVHVAGEPIDVALAASWAQ